MRETISSPCVRKCCLDEADVCVGCGRNIDEICNWTKFSEQQRLALIDVAKKRIEKDKKAP